MPTPTPTRRPRRSPPTETPVPMPTPRPTLPPRTLDPRLAELGDFLQKTASAAVVVPDRTLENYVREQAGLPEAEDQEDLADG